MLIAALVVGLLTAYYFGLRPGMLAAGATAALFVVAMVVPAVAVWAYVTVGVGVAGLCWLGPKLRRNTAPARYAGVARRGVGQVVRLVRRRVDDATGKGKGGDRAQRR